MNCRCWRCWARGKISKPLAEYVRPPKCKRCGHATLFVPRERNTKRDKRNKKCSCTGYFFTHRKGSKWCAFNVNLPEMERAA